MRTLRSAPPLSAFLSRPYAIAAAVGSLMMRMQLMPAMTAASLVAWRCESLKYAGTVTTAFFTSLPRNASATSFIFTRIMDEISSAENSFCSPWNSTEIMGFSASPDLTLNGQSLMSAWTCGSEYLRPMRRFASNTVLTGFIAVWFFAASPMRRSESVNATYEGVVRAPMSLAMISTLRLMKARSVAFRGACRGKRNRQSPSVAERRESVRREKNQPPVASHATHESRLRFLETGMPVSRTSNATSTVEFPKASRLFHRSSRRGADFFPRSSAVVASAEAPRRRRRRRIPRAERGDASKDIARDGFGRVTGARRFECVDRGAFATRSRGGGMAPFFERRDPRESRLRAGYVPVVLPDADAGVRRAEVDPDSGAVNLGHDALTGEVSERWSRACARRTGK